MFGLQMEKVPNEMGLCGWFAIHWWSLEIYYVFSLVVPCAQRQCLLTSSY